MRSEEPPARVAAILQVWEGCEWISRPSRKRYASCWGRRCIGRGCFSCIGVLFSGGGQAFLCKGAAFAGSAASLLGWCLLAKGGCNPLAFGGLFRFLPFVLGPLAGVFLLVDGFSAALPAAAGPLLCFAAGCGAALILMRIAHGMLCQSSGNSFSVLFIPLLISCLISSFASTLPAKSIGSIAAMILFPAGAYMFSLMGENVRGGGLSEKGLATPLSCIRRT